MNLSKFVTRAEFERSTTALRRGILNQMNTEQLENAKALCIQLDKIRAFYGQKLIISSGYRCAELNRIIGGAVYKNGKPKSQHCNGEAADFTIEGVTIEQVYQAIKTGKIPVAYDQLIHEGAWIHLSFKRAGINRRENLRAHFGRSGTTYTPG